MLSVVLLDLFALPFLWFIAHVDRYEREPAKLALLGFVWGGLAAPWVLALTGNGAVLSIYAKLFGVDFASSWGPPLTAPFVEESSKYIGLILLFLLARNHVRSAYDGLLLGAFTGLGFQVFENFQYMTNAVVQLRRHPGRRTSRPCSSCAPPPGCGRTRSTPRSPAPASATSSARPTTPAGTASPSPPVCCSWR